MKTGVIGLGAMGAPMARNLAKADQLACVWNRTREKAQGLAAEIGVRAADEPASLAQQCELIITCVSADQDVLAVTDKLLA